MIRYLSRRCGCRRPRDAGMISAEYAVGTLAAVAFAATLLKVVSSGPVQQMLSRLIERALQ